MGIKEEHIEVTLISKTITYYESLGYHIPRSLDKKGRIAVPSGTKLIVKVCDLPPTTMRYKVTKICDVCGVETKNLSYGMILKNRRTGDGLDRCYKCSRIKSVNTKKENVPLERSLGSVSPELLSEWDIIKNRISAFEIYGSSHERYWWICPNCKSSYDMPANERMRGRNCPYCAGRRVNNTNSLESNSPRLLAEWDHERNSVLPSDVTLSSSLRINWKCIKGHKWEAPIYSRSVNGCPHCAGVVQKTTESFKNEIASLVGTEYSLLTEYISSSEKIKLLHNVCGKSYSTTPASFLKGARCHFCNGGISYSHEDFINVLISKRPNFYDEYEILSRYIRTSTKMKVRHIKCGCEFKSGANKLLMGASCPICHGYTKKDTKVFAHQVKLLTNGCYELVSEYITDSDKVKLKHLECGHVYNTVPSYFIQGGARCPRCRPPKKSESKGEERIRLHLSNNNYTYVPQFEFEDCRDRTPLKFDFAVLESKDESPLLLIEFDGLQHYEPVKYWGGQKTFNNIRRRDKIKDDYCKSHNIPLIRIKYTEFDNIESILDEKLAQLNILPVSPALS
ncbi:zinc-ribbon domain-containing protein [Paenibacillus sp. T2-29]|uniref:zinc-ribbon domain-containing protein n=1 Tax=Paenibacillus TaxID=44249 RepID=UPI0039BCBCFC